MNLRVVLSRKVEELVDNQSRRWEEFCRMANNMKSLSADMIQQVNIRVSTFFTEKFFTEKLCL